MIGVCVFVCVVICCVCGIPYVKLFYVLCYCVFCVFLCLYHQNYSMFAFFTWNTVTRAQSSVSKFFRSHCVSSSSPLLLSQNLHPNRFIPRILLSCVKCLLFMAILFVNGLFWCCCCMVFVLVKLVHLFYYFGLIWFGLVVFVHAFSCGIMNCFAPWKSCGCKINWKKFRFFFCLHHRKQYSNYDWVKNVLS